MTESTRGMLQARPIPVPSAAPPASPTNTLLIILAVVATLYIGQDLLVPIALAILLSFVLSPVVNRLRAWYVPRIPAVVAVVALVFVVLAGFGTVVGSQVADLARNVPTYERNLRAKIQSVQAMTADTGTGVFSQVSEMFRDLRTELEEATKEEPPPAAGAKPEPMTVIVQEPDRQPLEVLQQVLGPVLAPIATAGMVLVFTIFMLLQREDMRDRLIRLVGSGDLSRTTEAMNDAAVRVSRYLLMQVVVNVTYGIPIGLGLALLGVPNPILWGLMATVLRFIPFAGPVIAASFPIMLSFAVDPGWTLPLLCVALFVSIELFSNNVVEPWLYGSATGLSSVAIIIAAVFWTTLWGPIGLLLATPLTVCLVVLGRHVPQLHFLEVMLGDRPVLPDEAKVYQRLLARDPEEAVEVCERLLETRDVPDVYEKVLLPALSLAEQDRQRGSIDTESRHAVADGFKLLVENLAENGEAPPPEVEGSILCVGTRNDLDEAAGSLLADLLRRRGVTSSVVPCDRVGPRSVGSLGTGGVRAVVLSYLNPSAMPHARRLVRRLRLHFGPQVPIVLALWSAAPEVEAPARATAETAADRIAISLTDALDHLEDLGAIPARADNTNEPKRAGAA